MTSFAPGCGACTYRAVSLSNVMVCCSHPSSGIRGRQIMRVVCIFHMPSVDVSFNYLSTRALCLVVSMYVHSGDLVIYMHVCVFLGFVR